MFSSSGISLINKKYSKAEDALQKALEVLESSQGTNNEQAAIALNNLAKIYINQGNLYNS